MWLTVLRMMPAASAWNSAAADGAELGDVVAEVLGLRNTEKKKPEQSNGEKS